MGSADGSGPDVYISPVVMTLNAGGEDTDPDD